MVLKDDPHLTQKKKIKGLRNWEMMDPKEITNYQWGPSKSMTIRIKKTSGNDQIKLTTIEYETLISFTKKMFSTTSNSVPYYPQM